MRTDYLNPSLYNALYSAMTYDNVLALRVSLETGLRIDDVLSLRFEQLKGRTITGSAMKTGKAYKKVLSADLANRLRGICPKKSGYFFPHRLKADEHRTRQAVWANMKKAARLFGVEVNAAPHSARKTYGVEVFKDKGFDAAQKELQHDRMSTTMLYVFSDMVNKCHKKQEYTFDCDSFAELIAEKVVEKLKIPLEKGGLT